MKLEIHFTLMHVFLLQCIPDCMCFISGLINTGRALVLVVLLRVGMLVFQSALPGLCAVTGRAVWLRVVKWELSSIKCVERQRVNRLEL